MAFIVINYAAGETTVEVMDKATLKTKLDAGELGTNPSFLDGTNVPIKPSAWGGKVLIIQGTAVVPTPQTIITRWTLA